MTCTIFHKGDLWFLSELLSYTFNHLEVRELKTRADIVGLADNPLLHKELKCGAVVIDIEPLAHILTIAVYRDRLPSKRIRDDSRHQVARGLAGAIVVACTINDIR